MLQFFPHSEGYVARQGSSYKYVFQYKDHLGNVRLSYTKNPTTGATEIIEESHYYPFGLKHSGYNNSVLPSGNVEAQKFKYNGKELQDELGLNMYDYGARNYDAAIGRWMNMDPMAELSRRFSPYTYAMNNPVFFIDPDGMIVDPSSQKEWDKQKKSITSERDRLQGKVDKLNATAASKGWSAEKLAGKIGDMSDRITGMNSSLGNLGTLEQSAQSYSLNVLSAGSTGDTSYDPASGNVVISFAGTANFVHESTHAGQYESGDIAFDSVSGKPYASDTGDEISAYKAQYAYDPSSVSGLTSSTSVKSSADITVNWLQNVSDSSGNKIYAPGGSANTGISPLNTNSNRADILKAFPNNPALQSLPSNFTFKSISTLKYRK